MRSKITKITSTQTLRNSWMLTEGTMPALLSELEKSLIERYPAAEIIVNRDDSLDVLTLKIEVDNDPSIIDLGAEMEIGFFIANICKQYMHP